MLIHALCNYYDVLARNGAVLPDGYSNVDISYLIQLNLDGTFAGLIDYRITDTFNEKKKFVARQMLFPLRITTTKIESNIVEHRGEYIFGLSFDTKTKTLKADNLKKFNNFKEKNLIFFDLVDSELLCAYKNFLKKWNPEEETENKYLTILGKDIKTMKFAFCLTGHPEQLLQEDNVVLKTWQKSYDVSKNETDNKITQCAVLGIEAPIARIHNKISGLYGGNATGNVLVGFKESAYDSYGATQSYNSNISETAMLRYTEAMNFLISNPLHRTILDEITVIHWAEDGNEESSSIFTSLFELRDTADKDQTNHMLHAIFKETKEGVRTINEEVFNDIIDPDVKYYMVGIKPNAARISVKFMYCQTFGKLLRNVLLHMEDMQLYSDMKPVPLWRIQKELVSPKSTNDKLDPSLSTRLMQSITMGNPYPVSLLATVIRRIKTDSNEEKRKFIKINDTRMGIIKAYVNRQCRVNGKREEITMALDKNNKNPAYVCGRLFAVLENIQQRSAGYNLNRTIRDVYFSTAASQPAIIFPKLISLSQHHMSKLENARYLDKEIQDLMELLDTNFPKTLSLTDQGVFMLGYYQQKADTNNIIKEHKEKKQ